MRSFQTPDRWSRFPQILLLKPHLSLAFERFLGASFEEDKPELGRKNTFLENVLSLGGYPFVLRGKRLSSSKRPQSNPSKAGSIVPDLQHSHFDMPKGPLPNTTLKKQLRQARQQVTARTSLGTWCGNQSFFPGTGGNLVT